MNANSSPLQDWTTGGAGIVYQTCRHCGHRWYFQRNFCPACGDAAPTSLQASGRGTVHARTTVVRAPTAEFAAEAPYVILLVDAEEGFRMMCHGHPDAHIGDAVVAEFRMFAGRLLPCFVPRSS